MCKKCIPVFVAKQNKSKGGVALTQQQKIANARMLGISSHVMNPYATEKTLISKSI